MIWLDVTTILRWRRPATGVVRVEAEVFRALSTEAGVKFCEFDAGAAAYRERSATEVREVLERNALGDAAPPRDTAARRVLSQADALLRQAPLPLFKALSRLKQVSTPVLRTALHRWREASGQVRTFAARRRAGVTSGSAEPTALFQRGDVLVSAGLDWDFKDLSVLYRLKQEHGFRVVLVCYDLIPVLLPHLCRSEVAARFPGYYADVAWVADRVLCISESSQRDFQRYVREIGAPLPATSLLRLGSTLDVAPAPDASQEIDGPFILFVSTLERRKNHEVLYRALVRLKEQGRERLPKLVFVGMRGWGVDDLIDDLERDPRVRDCIVRLHHVTDASLQSLYRRAAFTVFPSLYEGWGLPVAESLAHGRFCIAADTSSLREVGRELVDYLDPVDSAAWAARLAHFLDHPQEVARREAIIRERFVPTPWSETARAVLQAARESC